MVDGNLILALEGNISFIAILYKCISMHLLFLNYSSYLLKYVLL